ncbi:MAG: AsmA family protein [Rhizobiales bacterium]|nr:AsmA family protein [Hyphomicrobiales bacterium]
MKRIIAALLVLLAVFVAVIAIAPLFLSTDAAKKRIAEEISGWTGRQVTLTGEPEVSLFPTLTVTLHGINIANPAGMGGPPFISMEAVVGRIKLLPLFLGRTEIAEFSLIKPRINLRIAADGRQNWREIKPLLPIAPTKPGGAAKPAESGAPPSARPAPTITLGRFVMQGGIITFENERTGEHDALNAVDIDFSWPSLTSPASGSGSFVWRGETVEFDASVGRPLELMGGDTSNMHVALSSTPVRFSFDGTGGRIQSLQLDGQLKLKTPSMRRLMEWFGSPLGPGNILGPAELNGHVAWNRPDLAIDKASLSLDGNAAEGAMSVRFDGDRPSLQGTFAADKLDVTPYIDALREKLATAGHEEIMLAGEGSLDLRVSAAELIAGPTQLTSTALWATMGGGKLSIDLGEAHAYGGEGQAKLSAAMDDAGVTANFTAQFDGIAAAGPLGDYLGIGALSGTGSGDVEITAAGRTWGEVAKGLSGSAKATLADGALAGLDIARLANIATDPEGVAEKGGSTAFSELGGTLTVAGAKLTSGDIHAEGDGFAIRAEATASVLDASLTGSGTLSVVKPDQPTQPSAVPFLIKGKWSEPVLLPDYARQGSAGGPPTPGG